jgi:hypothetical protein
LADAPERALERVACIAAVVEPVAQPWMAFADGCRQRHGPIAPLDIIGMDQQPDRETSPCSGFGQYASATMFWAAMSMAVPGLLGMLLGVAVLIVVLIRRGMYRPDA